MSSITTEDFSSKKVIFIVGPAASGKSTLAYSINTNHCEADKYHGLYDKEGNIVKKFLYKAHKRCQNEFGKQLNENNSLPVVVSNTFGNLSDLKCYLNMILEHEQNTGKKCEVIIYYPTHGLRHFVEEGVVNEEQQEYKMIERRLKLDKEDTNPKVVPKVVPKIAMEGMIKKFKDNRKNLIEMSKLNDAKDLMKFLCYRNFTKRDISKENIIVRGKLKCLDHNDNSVPIIKYEISNDQILKMAEDNIIDLPYKKMRNKKFHITIFYGEECANVNENDLIKEIDFSVNSLFQTYDEGLFCLSVDTNEIIFNLIKRLHITLGFNRRKGYSPVNSNDLLEYAKVEPYDSKFELFTRNDIDLAKRLKKEEWKQWKIKLLPDDLFKYFEETEGAEKVLIDDIEPIRRRPRGVTNASKLMGLAYFGELDRRKPISLQRLESGKYKLLDGNSTYAIAYLSGWKHIYGIVV
jgi:energy-coupling factor transporter ATP-binding protein EcfA2